MQIIGHIDMDAFFASVEEVEKPYLKGMPIAVGADPEGGFGRGVVSTANYPARQYGVSSAVPIREAFRRSEEARKQGKPAVVFITPHLGKYKKVSDRIFKWIASQVDELEIASIDEGYVRFKETEYTDAKKTAERIRAHVKKTEGLTASIGIGPNRLVAKIASDYKKPDGCTVVSEAEVIDFLAPLPIQRIPGIGPKATKVFARKKIFTIKDARRGTEAEYIQWFGKWGKDMYARIWGYGDTALNVASERKSVGVHDTLHEDSLSLKVLTERIKEIAEEVYRRFELEGFVVFRTVVVTVRFADFKTVTRSLTLSKPSERYADLERTALKLLLPFLDRQENPEKKPVRMLGLRLEKISKEYFYTQGTLL